MRRAKIERGSLRVSARVAHGDREKGRRCGAVVRPAGRVGQPQKISKPGSFLPPGRTEKRDPSSVPPRVDSFSGFGEHPDGHSTKKGVG